MNKENIECSNEEIKDKSLMDKAKDSLNNIKEKASNYIGGNKTIEKDDTNENLNENNNLNLLQENTKENLNSGWDNNIDVLNKDDRKS